MAEHRTAHQLTLSARRPDGCPTVRLVATCACLGWTADLTVPAPMTRDADRWVRNSWTQHAATAPAVAAVPDWLLSTGGAA